MSDLINHPEHYTGGSIECIDAIKAVSEHTGFLDYLRGNVMKYLWRANKKGSPIEDIKKAQWYLNRLLAEVELITQDKPTEPDLVDLLSKSSARNRSLVTQNNDLEAAIKKLKSQLTAAKKPVAKKRGR